MKKIAVLVSTVLFTFCTNKKAETTNETVPTTNNHNVYTDTAVTTPQKEKVVVKQKPTDFIPKGYIEYKPEGIETLKGDLNNDGLADVVLMIKGTDKSKIITHESRGKLDQNRRGVVVLFATANGYELASKNVSCFYSENEDGGVYYAPEIDLGIDKGKLLVHFSHGRYGYWSYTFRYEKTDFRLIGYDSYSSRGPVPQYVTSINFLTKKKLTRDNLNKDQDGDEYEENFVDTWENLKTVKPMYLATIKEFDDLEF